MPTGRNLAWIGIILLVAAPFAFYPMFQARTVPLPDMAARIDMYFEALTSSAEIPALDPEGREVSIRYATGRAVMPGPCLRETGMVSIRGGRQSLSQGRARFFCRFDVDDTEAGPVRVVVQSDYLTSTPGYGHGRAMPADEAAELLARIEAERASTR